MKRMIVASKNTSFDDFYQKCWDKLLEDWRKQNPEGEVDQSTQGGQGNTELWEDGFGSGYYFSIDESEAISNCKKVYDSNGSIEEGVDAIYDAGWERENEEWNDEEWDDEDE